MHIGKASIKYSSQLKSKSGIAMYLQQLLALYFNTNKDVLLPHMRCFMGGWMAPCFITYKSQFGRCLCGAFSENL